MSSAVASLPHPPVCSWRSRVPGQRQGSPRVYRAAVYWQGTGLQRVQAVGSPLPVDAV